MRWLLTIASVGTVVYGCASGPSWKRQGFAFSLPADPPTTNANQKIVELSHVSISPLFQSRSFTYRVGENSYEQDPYAGFLVPPERTLAESIRAWMRAGGAFGRVVEPGSGIVPIVVVEVSVTELYGDFRKASQPVGIITLHLVCYATEEGAAQRIVFDRFCSHETPLAHKTPAALMAAWNADLGAIMTEFNSEYAKTISNNH